MSILDGGVVPFGMECVALDVESFHFGIGDLDSLFAGCSVERALDFQAGFGGGRGNQLDDGQAIGQGPRTPVCVMWQNMRCSILFHFEVPGG